MVALRRYAGHGSNEHGLMNINSSEHVSLAILLWRAVQQPIAQRTLMVELECAQLNRECGPGGPPTCRPPYFPASAPRVVLRRYCNPSGYQKETHIV